MQLKAAASEDGCRFTAANPTTRKVTKTPAIGRSTGASIPGIAELWAQTRGDGGIRVALLDGPVDTAHACFRGARLTLIESGIGGDHANGPARRHGTHLASVVFGQHGKGIDGLAPDCHGVIIPIFASATPDAFRACSQRELARGLALAVQHGAHIINISGGELSASGEAEPFLSEAIAACAVRGVLIVAAAGNDGCPCLHVPAAHRSVVAVGAMDASGEPLAFSNWGERYLTHGILAPGRDIVGARPGGGTAVGTGSSYAAAIVTGVAALLLSLQLKRGQRPDTSLVREALVRSAIDCATQPASDCRRLLAGRLDVRRSTSFVTGSTSVMSELIETPGVEDTPASNSGNGQNISVAAPAASTLVASVNPSQVQAAACGCQAVTQSVYVIGQIGHSFVSEARVDSIAQEITAPEMAAEPHAIAFDADKLLKYLDASPWEAPAVTWILRLHGTPIYAIQPASAFADEGYKRLRMFLEEQAVSKKSDRMSVGGTLTGTTTLLNGHTVPVIVPETRTLCNWNTNELVQKVIDTVLPHGSQAEKDALSAAIRKFLERLYHGFTNPGVKPQDRALNYVATNALLVGKVYLALNEKMELDTIQVRPSTYCRPGSDCWDVDLYFFDPANVQALRKVFRLTVDVSDLAPVFVGPMRSWTVR